MLFGRDNHNYLCRICDFGFAKQLRADNGMLMTPCYTGNFQWMPHQFNEKMITELFSQQTMWRPRFWKNRVTMQHATFGAWEFFFSLCCRDRFVVILMILIQYLEPTNFSFATTKKTKKNLQTPFATGPEDSPEDILRRFEIKSVL